MNIVKKFVPEKLREARNTLTQFELCMKLKEIGISLHPSTLSNWETGDSVPDLNTLSAIASITGKKIDFFLEAA